MDEQPDRRCGTCADWGPAEWEALGSRPCMWPRRNLPECLVIGGVPWMGESGGKNCPKWSKRHD